MRHRIEELCRLAQDGDINAASELLALHYEKIFGYFRRLCANESDASDLTQKTFCKVWRALPSYQGRSGFGTWIHGIGHHVYVDWRRASQRLDFQTDEWWQTCAAEGPSPFEDAAERETAHQLYGAVDQLDEAVRETVHLHYYQGLSLQETAEALDIATSTVKYRLRGALDFLRSHIPEVKR
jgi:RNA polymerase sigma-70 factor (ECF subfamily)